VITFLPSFLLNVCQLFPFIFNRKTTVFFSGFFPIAVLKRQNFPISIFLGRLLSHRLEERFLFAGCEPIKSNYHTQNTNVCQPKSRGVGKGLYGTCQIDAISIRRFTLIPFSLILFLFLLLFLPNQIEKFVKRVVVVVCATKTDIFLGTCIIHYRLL
jgi:hypothetical protein